MFKILLINPAASNESGRDYICGKIAIQFSAVQPTLRMGYALPLALSTLAGCTPDAYKVEIIDEEIEEIDFDANVDLVGLTAMTFKAPRAYEIAAKFKRRGIPVIMGGIHASFCPDEAAKYVDSVVIGEADDIWKVILNDAKAGNLKRRYFAENHPDITKIKPPSFKHIKRNQYIYYAIQTTRGCPNNCNYCTVIKLYGRKVRKKSIKQIIAEVDALVKFEPQFPMPVIDKIDNKVKNHVANINFTDDNLTSDRKHGLDFCRALKKYQDDNNIVITWATQVCADVAFDEELLNAMEESNCSHVFMGLESLDIETLKKMNRKMHSPDKYKEVINNFHSHGIRVICSIIIGDENTSESSAKELIGFITKNKPLYVLLNILTPYPGTDLYTMMKKNNRLLDRPYNFFNIRNVVFKHNCLSTYELQKIFASLCERLFNFNAVFNRGKPLLKKADKLRLTFWYRIAICFHNILATIYLSFKHRIPIKKTLQMLILIPYYTIFIGTKFAIELLVSCFDMDDFARSEISRFEDLKNKGFLDD